MNYVSIEELCEILNGYAFKSDNYVEEGVRIIRIANVQKGYIEDNTPVFCQYDNLELEKYMLMENDLLISLTGNVGRVALLTKEFLPAALNQRVACLRLKNKEVLKKYLFYCLSANGFEEKCIRSAKGVAQKNMSTEWLKKYKIPLYSSNEQIQIVRSLDFISRTINNRKKQLQKLDELIQARFVEMFGDPVENTMFWEKKRLEDIVKDDCSISYGIVQTGDDQEQGVPVFRPIDIVNHVPSIKELKKTTEKISDKYKKTVLKGRELLITVRANIADTCIVGAEFKGCNVGRGIVPIRTREEMVLLEFLKYLFDNKHFNDQIKSKAKGITLIQLNMEDLRQTEIVIPPIEQQRKFVQFVNQVNKSKVEIQQALEKTQLLFDSLMQQYFG